MLSYNLILIIGSQTSVNWICSYYGDNGRRYEMESLLVLGKVAAIVIQSGVLQNNRWWLDDSNLHFLFQIPFRYYHTCLFMKIDASLRDMIDGELN